MWAYRVPKAVNHLGMMMAASVLRDRLQRTAQIVEVHYKLDERLVLARNMARALGWDTTITGEPMCFLLPTANGFEYGILITQATSGQQFVVSPVPLKFLEESVSWNAHTSVDEVLRTQGSLSEGKIEPPEPMVGEWLKSRKGNYYTMINGANTTIFPCREGGFMAVIMNPTSDLKVYTKAFKSEVECGEYVVKNFYTLVKDWGLGGVAKQDNPFAGIDWSGDNDDNGTTHDPDDDIPF